MRWLWWSIGYLVVMLAIVVAMVKSRDWALAQLSTPESIEDWQRWRSDVEQQQANPGPVQRRVPKSSEPPALVLMRDHFATSIAGAIMFGSALYWVLVWFVTAIAAGKNR